MQILVIILFILNVVSTFVIDYSNRKRDEIVKRTTRNAIRNEEKRWPHGIIPYKISNQYSKSQKDTIMKAIKDFHEKTCVRFIPAIDSDIAFIYIEKDFGCFTDGIGRAGGAQEVSLVDSCLKGKGSVLHELMHVLGFYHEHTRYDRDEYIRINHENEVRDDEVKNQFNKLSRQEIDTLNEPYDYLSIMHYGAFAFSSNGKKTIEPTRGGFDIKKMGQRDKLSDIDIHKVNKLYNC